MPDCASPRTLTGLAEGEHVLEAGLPESFNVLLKVLQSLCLNVELIEDRNNYSAIIIPKLSRFGRSPCAPCPSIGVVPEGFRGGVQ